MQNTKELYTADLNGIILRWQTAARVQKQIKTAQRQETTDINDFSWDI